MYAIVARFKVKSGHVDEVISLLSQAAVASRQEPGCRLYVANQDLANPNTIVMYEQYDDEAAFQAHLASPHCIEIVIGKVVPLLESRSREAFAVVTPI